MIVVWSKRSNDELESIYNFILKKQKSPQNAVLVFNGIFNLAISLPDFPYKYPIEPLLKNEDIRYAVLWSFKIVFAIHGNSIVILRVFNTSQGPVKLNK